MKKTKNKAKAESTTTATMAAVIDAPLQEKGNVPPAGPGEFKIVPRAKVRPDPNQPRKVFDETKLQELADSIKSQGILSPLVVRHMPAKLKIEEPNMFHDDWQVIDGNGAVVFQGNEGPVKMLHEREAEDFFQIVFGERRWRAADLAGLKELPVIVRELTEREVFVQQFMENNARENLTPLEEAKAFQERIAKEKKTDPTFTAEKLAEALGIGRGTIYNRLALTRLIPPVLEAVTAGKIHVSVAGIVAMIPDPEKQEKLLAKLTNEDDWEYPFSFRDVDGLIEEEYCKALKDAPFDLFDEKMFAGAQMVKGSWMLDSLKLGDEIEFRSCEKCPFRTGNMKEAFPHIKNGNFCTKPRCYRAKCQAHFSEAAAAAAKKGQKVMTAKEFKAVKSEYVAAEAYSNSAMYGYWKDLMGKHAPEPVLVVTEEGLQKVYPREEAVEAAKKNGKKPAKEDKPLTAEQKAKEEAKEKEAAARGRRREKLVKNLAPALLKGLGKLKDSVAWEMCGEMVNSLEWPHPDMERALMKGHGEQSGKLAVLARCFSDGETYPVLRTAEWHKHNVELWKRVGVDLIEEEKKLEKAAPALPLAEAKPQQKGLLAVKKKKGGGKSETEEVTDANH